MVGRRAVPTDPGADPERQALRLLRGTAHGQRAPGHSSRLLADHQGPDLPLPRDAGPPGHPHRGVGHPRPAGRDRGREAAQAQRQEGHRGIRRREVQRPLPPERLHLQGGLGAALRPDRLLAGLRTPLHHLQQRVRRIGLVDPGPAVREGAALPRTPGAALLPPLWHRAVQPRAFPGLRQGEGPVGLRDLPAHRWQRPRAGGLDHDALDPAEQCGGGGASGDGVRGAHSRCRRLQGPQAGRGRGSGAGAGGPPAPLARGGGRHGFGGRHGAGPGTGRAQVSNAPSRSSRFRRTRRRGS